MDHQSVVLEWQVPSPGDPASTPDPATARELLRIDQPQFNHNAGALVFDADRLLLIALGDGGNADEFGVFERVLTSEHTARLLTVFAGGEMLADKIAALEPA